MCYREGRSVSHAASSSSLLAYVVVWDNTRTFAATHYSGSHAHPMSLLLHTPNVNVYRVQTDGMTSDYSYVASSSYIVIQVGGEQRREGNSTWPHETNIYLSMGVSVIYLRDVRRHEVLNEIPVAVKTKLSEREI